MPLIAHLERVGRKNPGERTFPRCAAHCPVWNEDQAVHTAAGRLGQHQALRYASIATESALSIFEGITAFIQCVFPLLF